MVKHTQTTRLQQIRINQEFDLVIARLVYNRSNNYMKVFTAFMELFQEL